MKRHLFTYLYRYWVIAALIIPISPYPILPASGPFPPPNPAEGQAVYFSLPSPVEDFTGCGGYTALVVNNYYEGRVVELVNAERTARGLPPLKRISLSDEAGRYHAKDMAEDNYFDHDSYDRSGTNLVKVCSWSSRISSYYSNWSSLGENIAAGYVTPDDVMNGWMNSDGHRANILRDTFWELGVGYYEGAGNYYRYWVQDFGKRNGSYPIIINDEAMTTISRDVSLYIYGSWTEMRLRNNSDVWSGWQPFHNRLTWQLPAVTGTHTVSVELRKTGSTASSNDTIYLDYPLQPLLGDLPDVITITYSIPSQQLLPTSVQVTPQNIGNGSELSWQVSTSDSWYDLVPPSGITPQSFTVIPHDFITDTITTYTGGFTVFVTSPAGVTGSPHNTTVILFVTSYPIYYHYLPALLR